MGGAKPSDEAEQKGTNLREWVGAAVVVALMGLGWAFDLPHLLSLERLIHERELLLAFAQMHHVEAVGLFIALYILGAALSLPGDVFLALAGGFLFGSVLGTLYVNIGATIWATLAFLPRATGCGIGATPDSDSGSVESRRDLKRMRPATC